MEPGESAVETLSEAEGLAEVVIESEPSGGAQTLFEQQDGRWVGNVEGSEMELTMQDTQVLSSVLSLQPGDPAIINTAEGINLSGEPVTWTAIYERTSAGIMTTHLEEPREVIRELIDIPPAEEDDVSTAPEVSVFQKPESIFESPIFAATEEEAEVHEARGKLWFEKDAKAEQAGDDNEAKGADIIDFFSRGHLFETEDEENTGSVFQPEARVPEESKDSEASNVIEAIFGQASLEESDNRVEDTAVEEAPAENNVVELFVGSAELVENPVIEDTADEDQDADAEPAEFEAELPAEETAGARPAVIQELIAQSPELTDEEIDQSLEVIDVITDVDQGVAVQLADHDAGELEIDESATEGQTVTLEAINVEEAVAEAVIAQTADELPIAEVIDRQDQALESNADAAPVRAEVPDIAVTIPEEYRFELDASEVVEAPAQLEDQEEEEVSLDPISVAEHVSAPDLETVEAPPELVALDDLEGSIDESAESKTEPAEKVAASETHDLGPNVVPELIAQQPKLETAALHEPETILPQTEQPAAESDAENVVRLEPAPDEFDLASSDWATEFGAPALEISEPEPIHVVSEPKREVRIRRHESGMLDITVTFETEAEDEVQTTKVKKAAPRTMRRAA